MRDADVRRALLDDLRAKYDGDPDTRIIPELGLCQGDVRIDVAVVNGSLNGYEIKSDADTLDRLPAQQEAYSKILDTVMAVAGGRHLEAVAAMVPDWWELCEAR